MNVLKSLRMNSSAYDNTEKLYSSFPKGDFTENRRNEIEYEETENEYYKKWVCSLLAQISS